MMAIDTKLVKMNPLAYEITQRTILEIDTKIDQYKDQKTKIYRLAILTIMSLVVLIAKVTWERFVGIELEPASISSFSIILGIFNLCIGLVTLGIWIDGKKKEKTIEDTINKLVQKIPQLKFYGEIVEIKEDSETDPEVLRSIKKILQPCFEKKVGIETNYRLIATLEITVEGVTPETFKCSPVKMKDNFDDVKTTIGIWRKYYAELLRAQPETPPEILRVVATQCVQDLPELQIEDEVSLYSCTSPLIENLGNGKIKRNLKGTLNQSITYQTVGQFRQYLAEMPDIIRKYLAELPKVNISNPSEPSLSSSDKIVTARRKSSGTINIIDEYQPEVAKQRIISKSGTDHH